MLTTALTFVDGEASLVLTYDGQAFDGDTGSTIWRHGDFVVTETGAGAGPSDGDLVVDGEHAGCIRSRASTPVAVAASRDER